MKAWPIVAAACLGLAAIVAPVLMKANPRLLWNATASTPVGLYRVDPLPRLRHGVMVAIRPSPEIAKLAAERHYLPLGLPLIKWVAGAPGDLVCRAGPSVSVNGKTVGVARPKDHLGRPLPQWQGCAWLGHDDVFVMNADVPDSFDGRYFGVLRRSSIIGRAVPVWTDRRSHDPAHT
jgi:conjugative transfer signal peptidase TraF